MFGLKDLVNFASTSGDGKIVVFAPQVSTHACAIFFIQKLTVLQKFIRVKYWQMTFNLPNSPKFSPDAILHHTVHQDYLDMKTTLIIILCICDFVISI